MTSCIPVAGGVPGLPGPPQWWSTDGPRPFDQSIDDPRWRGALRRGYESGAGEEGVFRALHSIEGGKPVLYLSWRVLHDPTGSPNVDEIHVIFQRPGAPLLRINVVAYSSLATSYEAQSTAGITVTSRPAGGGSETAVPTPAWLGDTRGWLTLPSGGGTSYEWAIAMRVPITGAGPDIDDNGINLGNVAGGSTFNFWYGIVKDLDAFAAAYYWPRTGARITIDPNTLENVYPSSGLDSVRTGSGPDCGVGIALNAIDIGTTNNDPTTGFPAPHLFLVSATSPTTNHVVARPTNTSGAVAANTLSASFRTANWGSAADFTTAVGATPWEEILPGTPKRNAAQIPAGDPATPTKGAIEFDWTISTAEAREWLPPPDGTGRKWRHQCLLVTLSGPYDFINDSTFRNMDFVKASVFERLAEINVRGLDRLAQPTREIYLYVERSNMPRDVEGEPEEPPDINRVIAALERGDDDEPRTHVPRERPQPTIDQIASLVPTVRYHVYHETGERIKVGGNVKPVVEEQTAFGHFVQHDGGVYGWDVVLGGEFRKIADNLFRLEVPEGGRTVINTKVHGWDEPPTGERPEIEPGPKQPPRGCLTIITDLWDKIRRKK